MHARRAAVHEAYRGKAVLALLMVVVSQLTFALNPSVEGLITSQLSDDAVDIINGVSGAHVHFDIILRIMLVLLGLYLLKTVSQLITAFCLTDAIQGTMHDLRNALQQKIQRLPVLPGNGTSRFLPGKISDGFGGTDHCQSG